MSKNIKELSASSNSLGPDDEYVYVVITDPINKGVWSDPAEFVWAIGEHGRKILLAGLLSPEFSPERIANVFSQGKYHNELCNKHGQMFICNGHDIVNAHKYMGEKGNVKFQQDFNEQNRKEWEQDPEQRMEVAKWIEELKKALHTLLELLAKAVRDLNDELDFQILRINQFLISVAAAVAVLTGYALERFLFGR